MQPSTNGMLSGNTEEDAPVKNLDESAMRVEVQEEDEYYKVALRCYTDEGTLYFERHVGDLDEGIQWARDLRKLLGQEVLLVLP